MHPFRMPFTPKGKVVSLGSIAAFLFSMTSCGTQLDPPDDLSKFRGLLINTDINSDLLGGIRLASGESVSLYGRFKPDGNIEELQEVVYSDAEGRTSSLQFVSGRPALAVLHDGSRLEVTYEEVNADRLKGVVDLTAATGETYRAPFDVDLKMALSELAGTIEDLTGGAVQIDELTGASDPTARLALPLGDAKDDQSRQQLQVGYLLFGAMIAGAGFLMVCTMAQMMEAVVAVIEVSMRPIVIAIFMPLIIMGEICRLAATEPWITIDVEIRPAYLPARRG